MNAAPSNTLSVCRLEAHDLNIHRALRWARRRAHWMRRARAWKAEKELALARFCVRCAREANHNMLTWLREARLDMERVL
jgi:hypothetical protein